MTRSMRSRSSARSRTQVRCTITIARNGIEALALLDINVGPERAQLARPNDGQRTLDARALEAWFACAFAIASAIILSCSVLSFHLAWIAGASVSTGSKYRK